MAYASKGVYRETEVNLEQKAGIKVTIGWISIWGWTIKEDNILYIYDMR